MPPPLNVVPTDFARYWSNGTGSDAHREHEAERASTRLVHRTGLLRVGAFWRAGHAATFSLTPREMHARLCPPLSRDSYITSNNGGLTVAAATDRFSYALRGAPGQTILLPSFTSRGGALAQEAIAATARADPKLRAQRAHQRAVSSYLHDTKSSRGTLSKAAAWRARTGTQPIEAGFGTTGRYVPIPVLGLPQQQWLALTGREAKMHGSLSARLPSKAQVVHNPYQRPLMARSWGEAEASESLRSTGRASRKLRVTQVIAETESRPRIPIAQRPMPRPEKPLPQPWAAAPRRAPVATNAAPQQQQQSQPQHGAMQQSINDAWAAAAAAEAQASPRFVPAPPARPAPAQPSPPRQQQHEPQQLQHSQQQPQQPQQSQSQSQQSLSQSLSHPQSQPQHSQQLYVPLSPPSYRVTLPKQMGTYCDGAMTHQRLPNYNDLPSAGQLTARLREKASMEKQVSILC